MGDWGVGDAGTVPDMVALLTPFSLTGAFDDFNPVGAPTGGWKGNANVLGQWASGSRLYQLDRSSAPMASCAYNPGFNTNSTVGEDTQAVYAQLALKFDLGTMPSNLVVGARYEETDVTSANLHRSSRRRCSWQDDNDFQVERAERRQRDAGHGRPATYNNLLPNLDFDIASDRFDEGALLVQQDDCSCGLRQPDGGCQTRVARAVRRSTASRRRQPEQPGVCCRSSRTTSTCRWSTTSRIRATCRPVRSTKNVENFIGNSVQNMNLFGIRNQTGGPRAQAAAARARCDRWLRRRTTRVCSR